MSRNACARLFRTGVPAVAAAAATLAIAGRCASGRSDAAQGVRVFHRREGYGAPTGPLPAGCRQIASHPSVEQTELELAVSEYDKERTRAAAAGGNVVIAKEEVLVPRRNLDCPVALPITDCPPAEGAWFRVVYEDYACSAEAVDELSRPPAR